MSSDSLLGMHSEALDRAVTELRNEELLILMSQCKARIQAQRARARWWHKFIPFTIIIRRREP